jgi:hypothetical protein
MNNFSLVQIAACIRLKWTAKLYRLRAVANSHIAGHCCFVPNFRRASIRTVLLAARKSRTLELLAFDEYCRFDTSAFF